MEYIVIITKEPDTRGRAGVPALPDCEAEAETREEVLVRIKPFSHGGSSQRGHLNRIAGRAGHAA